MCFQAFGHYSCGHTKLVERECELAQNIPLYIKVKCPNYRYESRRANILCGDGKFYCKQTKDGPFLDGLNNNLSSAQREIALIDNRIDKVLAVQESFTNAANAAGISLELRKKHPAYPRLQGSHEQLVQKRKIADHIRRRAWSTIQQAIQFYSTRAASGIVLSLSIAIAAKYLPRLGLKLTDASQGLSPRKVSSTKLGAPLRSRPRPSMSAITGSPRDHETLATKQANSISSRATIHQRGRGRTTHKDNLLEILYR